MHSTFWLENPFVLIKDIKFIPKKIMSKALNRSIAGQIEYWAKIGKITEENPDLNYELIKNILIGKEEVANARVSSYEFDK